MSMKRFIASCSRRAGVIVAARPRVSNSTLSESGICRERGLDREISSTIAFAAPLARRYS